MLRKTARLSLGGQIFCSGYGRARDVSVKGGRMIIFFLKKGKNGRYCVKNSNSVLFFLRPDFFSRGTDAKKA